MYAVALLKECYYRSSYFLTQSLSYRMTVSAAARLIPRPPARVDIKNRKTSGLLLNSLIAICRSSRDVLPSKRTYLKERRDKQSSNISIKLVKVENSKTQNKAFHKNLQTADTSPLQKYESVGKTLHLVSPLHQLSQHSIKNQQFS